ncbi:hypothetical protein CAPTEDRAFT_229402 [Capitella teleta]|uniref:Uncharacterized protein n=1 Tax=Capitella teleta TaxID=283909 RepID=R7T3U3_CAPTE|nr:hypothetical protein CAPTEDRAFT_229402 [Capitella teleta]|eukprot:ELT87351.1 hypothetical protein CAPTEDRAFT_229402 [Capitella teleta]
MRALQAGVLVGWNVFTARGRRSQRVYLQVWRPVDVNRRAYRLVGETKIAALWVGHSFFPLRPPDRILVEPGDVLGLHFPRFNPIPWSPVPCDRNNEHFFKYNPSRLLAMKGTIVFDRPAHDWMPCRNYSFNASIMTTREMELWDASYENDTIGRYEFRPYGDHIPTRRSDVNGSTSLSTSLSSLAIFLVILIVVIFGANLG